MRIIRIIITSDPASSLSKRLIRIKATMKAYIKPMKATFIYNYLAGIHFIKHYKCSYLTPSRTNLRKDIFHRRGRDKG